MLALNRCVKAFGARYIPSGRGSCQAGTEGLFAVPKDFSRISASTRAGALANASALPELSGIVRVCGLPSPGSTLYRVTSQRGLIYDVVIAYICTGAIPRLGMLSLNRCVKAFGARYTPSGRGSCRAGTESFFAVPTDFSRISASTRAEALANASARPELSRIVRVWSSLPLVDLVIVTSQLDLIYDVAIAYICTGAIQRLGILSLK